ncbi:hypothetical protein HYH03_016820 [Edaphochlamys debaryana]|uniref:Cytochrome b561 domain-containing protein n=1 Tax=Edaphochlamys debaryana TaxID=47281 RepID=A0A836BPJ4_9CHLO|nr:hypothetical protein HYH03_016820 [Edaphochlamys debaryana]|eukprot:KAG2484406.1 hypothetical protein HYH03_016820 [Edaphochlamys debaryana]
MAAYLGEENLGARLCPGQAHVLEVSYLASNGAPEGRRALLTSSLGSLEAPAGPPPGYLQDPNCGNRVYLAPHSSSLPGFIENDAEILNTYRLTLRLPCDAAGKEVSVVSSSATHECLTNCGISNIRLGTWTVTVDPVTSDCAAAACRPPGSPPPPASPPPPPPSPKPPTPPPSSPPPPPSPSPPADAPRQPPSPPSPQPSPPSPQPSPPPTSPNAPPLPLAPKAPRAPPPPPRPPFPPLAPVILSEEGAAPPNPPMPPAPPSSCAPSTLGYRCSQALGKVVVHWTLGGAAPPPNACTGPSPEALASGEEAFMGLAHFAVASDVSGYVSLGFPEDPASMFDADMVLGWATPDGRGTVDLYHVTSYEMASTDIVRPSWLLASGVVEGNGTTTLCFSRRMSEPRAKSSPLLLDTSGVMRYSWAISPQDALVEHPPDGYGAGIINMQSGAATQEEIKDNSGVMIAHGVLMAVAWVLMLPLGAMVPAHRWILPGKVVAGKAIWFWLHMILQLGGFAVFAAGFILALVRFDRPVAGTLASKHAIMGYVVCGLVGTQVLVAFVRPDPGTMLRNRLWNPLHFNLGRACTLLAWATCLVGAAVHADSIYRAPIAAWVAPLGAVMGVLLLTDWALRDARSRRTDRELHDMRSRRYEPGSGPANQIKQVVKDDAAKGQVPSVAVMAHPKVDGNSGTDSPTGGDRSSGEGSGEVRDVRITLQVAQPK